MIPLALNCAGRKVLIVGGGPVATRKCKNLLDAGAAVTLVAPDASDYLRQQAHEGQLTWHRRVFTEEDLDGVWLVFIAVNHESTGQDIARLCYERQIWFWLGGQPESSAFWSMAQTRRQGVTVAVSAGGRPRLAQELVGKLSGWLREQLPEL